MLCSKHVEDNSVTNILLMNKENCALKLVDEIILYVSLSFYLRTNFTKTDPVLKLGFCSERPAVNRLTHGIVWFETVADARYSRIVGERVITLLPARLALIRSMEM